MLNSTFSRPHQSTASKLLNLLGFMLLCYFGGQLIGLLLTEWLFNLEAQDIAAVVARPTQAISVRNSIIFLQATSALFSLILLPAAYLYFFQDQRPTLYFAPAQKLLPLAIILTAVLVIVFMPVNAIFIEWNKHLQLPALFTGLEQREQRAAQLTAFFTTFTSLRELAVGLFFIALIPAIGEEFFFRGVIQTRLASLLKNKHIAIVCTSILFSLFHFQFYGLLPRMLQGILFGYLFYWSGNLWYAVIAHFVNNGVIVLAYYLWQHKLLNVNITDSAIVPLSLSLVCLLLTVVLFFSLKRYFFRYIRLA